MNKPIAKDVYGDSGADLGSLQHPSMPTALGHEADNLDSESEPLSCCGWPLDDDGFCHGCWEHCL